MSRLKRDGGEEKKSKSKSEQRAHRSRSVEEWFCLTLREIYDVGEVFTEVRAAHFPNQLVKHFAYLKRAFHQSETKKSDGADGEKTP